MAGSPEAMKRRQPARERVFPACRKIKISVFTFQQFVLDDSHSAMKVGTDGVLLGAWSRVEGCRTVLDVGCGCGLVALMLAQRNGLADVTGVEMDAESAADAVRNAGASPFAPRVEIVQADVTRLDFGQRRFDCIVSNPPYHEEELLPPAVRRAAARHTSGGGLTFAALLRVVARWLAPPPAPSRFCVILPALARERFEALALFHGLYLVRRTDVVTRPGKPAKRVLLEFRTEKPSSPCQPLTLALQGDDGRRSADYESLCADFYLRRP